jgi:hypothetical protein
MTKQNMATQKTYKKKSPTKIFFALAFLISLSFFPGVGSSTASQFQGVTKTELVVSSKVKTPKWTIPFHKKVNLKSFIKSHAVKINETAFLSAYNILTKVKFRYLLKSTSSLKFPYNFFRIKTIPKTSEENDFISSAG